MNEMAKKKSARPVWLILTITASVLFGAFLILPHSEAQRQWLLGVLGTSNKGVLLTPATPLAGLELTDREGKVWSFSTQKPRWRLLIPVADGCTKTCRDALYLTRQVHVRLERNAHRMERILLNLGSALDADTLAFLDKEHPHLVILNGERGAFEESLRASNGPWSSTADDTYVVDPAGVAMLYFTPEHDGGDMLDDLRHLMKYSPES